MADLIDYINQANHNMACAEELADGNKYRDWAITAAFYSAIHSVEAGLEAMGLQHPAQSRRSNESVHDLREQLVREKFSSCFKQYRALRTASQSVRYLSNGKPGTALTYYSVEDVKLFINQDLQQVRNEVQEKSGYRLE